MLLRFSVFALFLVSGCIAPYDNDPLPNDYRFIELSRGNGAIVDSQGNFAVYPNVVEYRLEGDVVIGMREHATDNTDYSKPFVEGLGYFVLDTSTGELTQGLPELPVQ